MKTKSVLDNRHKLLLESMEKNYSEDTLLKISLHMKIIPTKQKEKEAERIIQMMNTMSEMEVLANL